MSMIAFILEDFMQSFWQYSLYEGVYGYAGSQAHQYELMTTTNLWTVLFSSIVTLLGSIFKLASISSNMNGMRKSSPCECDCSKDKIIIRSMFIGVFLTIIINMLRIVNIGLNPKAYTHRLKLFIFNIFMFLSFIAFTCYSIGIVIYLSFSLTKDKVLRTMNLIGGLLFMFSLIF